MRLAVLWIHLVWFVHDLEATFNEPYFEYLYTRKDGVAILEPLYIPTKTKTAGNQTVYLKNDSPTLTDEARINAVRRQFSKNPDPIRFTYPGSASKPFGFASNRGRRPYYLKGSAVFSRENSAVKPSTELQMLLKQLRPNEAELCVDGQSIFKGCNHCICMGGQLYVCTARNCGPENQLSVTTPPECIEGEFIRSFDGCNRCYCGHGRILCTKSKCKSDGGKQLLIRECTPGQKIESADDCNTCSCNTKGLIVCTTKACGPELNITQLIHTTVSLGCVPDTWYSQDGHENCKECYCINGKTAFCYLHLCSPAKMKLSRHVPVHLSLPGALPDYCDELDYMQDKCTSCVCKARSVWSCKTRNLNCRDGDTGLEDGGGGGGGKAPGRPDSPGRPNRPGRPDRPRRPDIPGRPDRPGKPDRPGRPKSPEGSENHGKPVKPRTPGQPGQHVSPRRPEGSDTHGKSTPPTKPGTPGGSDKPSKSDRPNRPNRPGVDQHGRPESGGGSENHGKTVLPSQPHRPGKPDKSDNRFWDWVNEFWSLDLEPKIPGSPSRPIRPRRPDSTFSEIPGQQNIPKRHRSKSHESQIPSTYESLSGSSGYHGIPGRPENHGEPFLIPEGFENGRPVVPIPHIPNDFIGLTDLPVVPGASVFPGVLPKSKWTGTYDDPDALFVSELSGGLNSGKLHDLYGIGIKTPDVTKIGSISMIVNKGPPCLTGQSFTQGNKDSCQGCFCTVDKEWKCWSIKNPCRSYILSKCTAGNMKKNHRTACSVCYCGADRRSFCATDETCAFSIKPRGIRCEILSCSKICLESNAKFGVCHENKCVCV